MKIVFLASDLNSRIKTMLKVKFNAEMIHIKNGAEVKSRLLMEDDICLILGDSNCDGIEDVIVHLQETFSIIPYIDISENEISSKIVNDFLKSQDDIIRAPTPIDTKVLEEIVSSALNVYQRKLHDKYREIRIE